MRWWRRNDGFEWKEYVRTTVLVRRQQRRDRIEAAKAAAVEGVKDAGRKGLAAGAAGAEAAGQAAVKIAEGAAGGAEKGLALAVRGAAAARSRIAAASAPVTVRLSGPRVAAATAAVAALAGVGCGVRWMQFGLDWDAALLGFVAVAAAGLWLWPRLFSHTQEAADDWAVRTERAVAVATRADSWLPPAAAAAFAACGLWFAAPVISRWIDRAAAPEASPPAASEAETSRPAVRGSARVAGAGLLQVGQTMVRLDGLTMLDPAQTCRRPDGTDWACGTAAQKALEKAVRRRAVDCIVSPGETTGTASGTCSSGGEDLGAEIVRSGHGFADGFLWAAYSAEEAIAREAKAGLWAGEPERPEDWRARIYSQAAQAAPGGCPIKGVIQRGRKIFVLPYSADYAGVSIRADRGERWFCTADEAVAAGFRPRDK